MLRWTIALPFAATLMFAGVTSAHASYSPRVCRYVDLGAAARSLGGTVRSRESSVDAATSYSHAYTTCGVIVKRAGKHDIDFWVDASCFKSAAAATADVLSNDFFHQSVAEPLSGIGDRTWGMPGANNAYDLFVVAGHGDFVVSGNERLRKYADGVGYVTRWLPKRMMIAAAKASLRLHGACP